MLDGDKLFSFDQHPPSTNSTFYVDPFNIVAPPTRQTNSPLTMLSTSSSNYKNNTNQSTFYYQQPPQFVPTRPVPSVPLAVPNTAIQRPLTLENLNLNPKKNNNNVVNDLLDLGDPGSPPPSPKFDPYG